MKREDREFFESIGVISNLDLVKNIIPFPLNRE
jgi:hypothetical protein